MDVTTVDVNTGFPCRQCGSDYIFTNKDMETFLDNVNAVHAKHSLLSHLTGIGLGLVVGVCISWWIFVK